MRLPPRLAKLTRPDSSGLLSRERLFALLDRTRSGHLTWVSGSAGAGKTSLVASWLDKRKHQGIWYRVDAGDGDPATFFHYLGLAARPKEVGQPHLPHFTPEYAGGLRQFARRYFRDFFAQVRAPCCLVFDNCHAAGRDSPLEDILAWALEEAPRGVAVIYVSRQDPGGRFSHWMAEGAATHVSGEHLRLDACEARAIAEAQGYDQAMASTLVAQVDGWAAGFILALRAQARNAALPTSAGAQQDIFEYFTAELHAAADDRLQAFLLRTAVLPVIPPSLAQRLTGFGDAAALLEDLHRNHFFTERRSRPADEPLYEYHPLFREFLIDKARRELRTEEFAGNCRHAAALLEAAGRCEAAVALRIEGADWPALVRTIRAQASLLMSQGRWQTLLRWIEALPPAQVRSDPSLLYWRGTCVCLTHPAGGRADLEAAYKGFQRAGDVTGSLLACAGTLEAIYLEFSDQKPSIAWIAEMDRLLLASPVMPVEVEVRVIRSLMGALMAWPEHPLLARSAARAVALLRTLPDVLGATELMAFAGAYYLWAGELADAEAVLDSLPLDRQLVEGAPLGALIVCIMKSGVAWQRGDHEASYAMVDAAHKIANDSGVHVLDSFIATQAIFTALSALDLDRSKEELARMRASLDPRRRLEVSQHGVFCSAVALLAGAHAEALHRVEKEVPVVQALGAPFVATTFHIHLAQARILNGRSESAMEPLEHALAFARRMPSHILAFQALLTQAWGALRRGDSEQSLAALRMGLSIGSEHDYMNCHPLWIPDMMREIFEQALQADIETDYVRRFIRKRRIAPGRDDGGSWPWPVHVRTLGRFEIRKDDQALPATGKGKQRLLDLLKAIIAHGPHGASMERLAGILWPEAEGDTARDDLRVALHRLRKLLGDERAVLSTEGRILLNAQWCWVDAFAFEAALDKPRPRSAADGELFGLYKGHFLPADGDLPWLMAPRERLRSKFLRAIEAGGAELAKAGDVDSAIVLYRRAIEVDPLAEAVYRRLMECYAGQGRPAEAIDVYRRCRQMLSVVLGIKPGPETEALHDALAGGRHPPA